MRSFRGFAMLSCLSLALLAGEGRAAPASAPDANQSLAEQYASCTQMAALKPKETLARAQKWFEETAQRAAQHCMALAQFEDKNYAGAAETLDSILSHIDQKQGKLWYSIKKQAAKAHLYSGGLLAERHLTDALRYASDHGQTQDMVPLLLDRARIYARQDEHLRAIQDLDHALTLGETPAVRLERARVYLKMGDTNAAEADIRAVLKADPLNEEASRMLGELERRRAEIKTEEEKKAATLAAEQAASAPAPVTNNYYGGASPDSVASGRAKGEPARKLSFDERIAKARAERAAKYGWDK